MNKSKGFTIIELLVVVAIIAVLAAIVLFNVTKYIQQGKVASGKGNMAGLQIDGAVFYDTNGNYNGFCAAYFADGKPRWESMEAAGWTALACNCNSGGSSCTATSTAWCAIGTETGTTTKFCADSAGNKVESTTVTCPSSGSCV